MISAVSALGETLPPYLVFKGARITQEMKKGVIRGTKFQSSPSGWSNSDIFLDFFVNHFAHHIKRRPIVLLYDGHSTHYTADVIETARKENIHLFVLPPHSSHCLQPLDVSLFAPFKKALSTSIHKFMHENPTRVVTRDELPAMITAAFKSSMTTGTIMTGFRKSGIFPFCPSVPTPCPPVPILERLKAKLSRKERQDNRTIHIMLEGHLDAFEHPPQQTQKKPRKKFIPPHGALVSTEAFLNEKKSRATHVNQQNKAFVPSFTRAELSQGVSPQEEDSEEHAQQEQSQKECHVGKGKGSGKKGKGKMKKCVKASQDEDDEVCVVCKKWQPDAMRIIKSIRFAEWGQCDICDKWVHLRFCCSTQKLSPSEAFICPLCQPED